MITRFQTILRALCDPEEGKKPITGVRASQQFAPGKETPGAQFQTLNAAFLISLCGPRHPSFEPAERYLTEKGKSPQLKEEAAFYCRGLEMISREFQDCCAKDSGFAAKVRALSDRVQEWENFKEGALVPDMVWQVFFPEGVGMLKNPEEHIRALREKRVVTIDHLNRHPIQDPVKELLFTANVLLTVPPGNLDSASVPVSKTVRDGLERAQAEHQLYWYDHPVQVGTPPQRNEIIYGLRNLNQSVAFEKGRKKVEHGRRLFCVLSVSVTHKALRKIAVPYLREILEEAGKLEHLRVFAFTEADTARMVEKILVPAGERWLRRDDGGSLKEVFGVDGEYGRHYSFLKAVAAYWQVFVDPDVRGTFKIDLDQVFPQDQLVRETGLSALEHFMTPLWGAEGKDFQGRKVDLGMIAGALVNQADSKTSLFTPDVLFPSGDTTGSEWIFYSRLPQAVSTEAEMMTRYGNARLDGLHRVIQRIHVTGGTTGILVNHLRKYRPFTPTFVGRAEDQAYLLSMLGQNDGKPLRALHKAGLIMRHDKDAFAEEAIQAAATGKKVGDYIRMLIFSAYARAIHGNLDSLKKEVDPFTGCFISRLPTTIVYLRFALDVARVFQGGTYQEAAELANIGTRRIGKTMRECGKKRTFEEQFEKEKSAWDLYYDLLDRAEWELKKGDTFAVNLREEARRLLGRSVLSNF